MPSYVVKQGDTLSLIAKQFKLANWETIYNHPDNADFRKNRPNPNLIYPGDKLIVPQREIRTEDSATEQKHRFKVTKPSQTLAIAVEDIMGERIANEDYELKLERETYTGKTDGEGLFQVEIPIDAVKGKLTVGTYEWDILVGYLNPIETTTKDKGVSGAQGRLKNLGYMVGAVDGVMGPKTEAAIEAFQADENLKVTGKLDDETRKALVKVHNI